MDQITSVICDIAQRFHRHFSQKIWPNYPTVTHFQLGNRLIFPCYHNELHIKGAIEAARVTIHNAKKQDPFELKEHLQRWNRQYQTNISFNDFETVVTIAFACHDLGNLTKTPKLLDNGKLSLDFSDHFQLEVGPCEQRSSEIAMTLVHHLDDENVVSLQMKDLIKHLILQTVFNPTQTSSDQPFWLFVQFVDQVGSYFYSGVPLHIASAGYLNELSASRNVTERLPFNLQQYLSFFPDRFYQMFPDLKFREEVLRVFDQHKKHRNLFAYYSEVPARPIDYTVDVEEIYKGKWNKKSS